MDAAITRLLFAALVVAMVFALGSCAATTRTTVGITTVQDADAADKGR
jgi:hypothetical protein